MPSWPINVSRACQSWVSKNQGMLRNTELTAFSSLANVVFPSFGRERLTRYRSGGALKEGVASIQPDTVTFPPWTDHKFHLGGPHSELVVLTAPQG